MIVINPITGERKTVSKIQSIEVTFGIIKLHLAAEHAFHDTDSNSVKFRIKNYFDPDSDISIINSPTGITMGLISNISIRRLFQRIFPQTIFPEQVFTTISGMHLEYRELNLHSCFLQETPQEVEDILIGNNIPQPIDFSETFTTTAIPTNIPEYVYQDLYGRISKLRPSKKPEVSQADYDKRDLLRKILSDFDGKLRSVIRIPMYMVENGRKYCIGNKQVKGVVWDKTVYTESAFGWMEGKTIANGIVYYTEKNSITVGKLVVTSKKQEVEAGRMLNEPNELLDAIRMSCKATILNPSNSIKLFGFKGIKNQMMESPFNTKGKGFQIVDIKAGFVSKKSGKKTDVIILNSGDKNLMFLLEDVKIEFPDFKGITPKKDREIRAKSIVRIKNNKGLKLKLGTPCEVVNVTVNKHSRSNKNSIVAVRPEGSNEYVEVKLKQLKLI